MAKDSFRNVFLPEEEMRRHCRKDLYRRKEKKKKIIRQIPKIPAALKWPDQLPPLYLEDN